MTVQAEKNAAGGAVKTARVAALVVAGCAACCAPLIAAPVLGLLSAAGVGLALVGKIGLGILVLTGLGFYLIVRHRRSWVRAKVAKECECAPEGGCNTGNSCDLPANKPGLVERGRIWLQAVSLNDRNSAPRGNEAVEPKSRGDLLDRPPWAFKFVTARACRRQTRSPIVAENDRTACQREPCWP